VDAIRLMMEADDRALKIRNSTPEPAKAQAPNNSEMAEQPAKTPRRKMLKGRSALPDLTVAPDTPKHRPTRAQGDREPLVRRLLARVSGFRPTRKQIALTALAVVMVWRPWLIPGILFLLFWIALIVHLTLGPDRVAELLTPVREKLAARYPEKAAALRRRAQAGADRVEGWIEKLPERWRDGIYLPDLGRSDSAGVPEAMKADPFDRLNPGRGA
jgi:hypothetical protein